MTPGPPLTEEVGASNLSSAPDNVVLRPDQQILQPLRTETTTVHVRKAAPDGGMMVEDGSADLIRGLQVGASLGQHVNSMRTKGLRKPDWLPPGQSLRGAYSCLRSTSTKRAAVCRQVVIASPALEPLAKEAPAFRCPLPAPLAPLCINPRAGSQETRRGRLPRQRGSPPRTGSCSSRRSWRCRAMTC